MRLESVTRVLRAAGLAAFTAGLAAFSTVLAADVRLPRLLGDGVILQRNAEVSLWGWADDGETVDILLDGEPWATATAHDGRWRARGPERPAGGPHRLTFRGENTLVVEDVYFGDLWLASGQSNMEYPMNRLVDHYPDEIAAADLPTVRQFKVPKDWDFQGPRDDVESDGWQAATPETVLDFSAVGYFFAHDLHERYEVPIGIVNASYGGSPAEGWLSERDLGDWPHYLETARRWQDEDELAAVRERDQQRYETWYSELVAVDAGYAADPQWSDPGADDTDWTRMSVPGHWADTDLGPINGAVWFRRHFELPANAAGEPALLRLGRIVDADEAWINGTSVGATTYQYPQRDYKVPAGVLREGDNVIAVRVVNSAGLGGFVPDKPYRLEIGDTRVDLTGPWKMRAGAEAEALVGPEFRDWSLPLGYYNAMLAPLADMTIAGVIWYQGESNVKDPQEYQTLFPAMIRAWRRYWDQDNLPFVFVQLANFLEVKPESGESDWAETREAQAMALSLPNTGMATAIDLGQWNDIHPLDKKPVGERLALAARKVAYGEDDLIASGPTFSGIEVRGDRLVLGFDHVGGGLRTHDDDGGALSGFAIAGENGPFRWAEARIEGDAVAVWHDEIAAPVRVRYAWADNPDTANLYNAEDLPAVPFRATARWFRTPTGVEVRPTTGDTGAVRLAVIRDDIVRVTAAPGERLDPADSIMVVAERDAAYEVTANDGRVTLTTHRMSAEVALDDGAVRFLDADSEPLLAGVNGGEFGPVTRDPEPPRDGYHALRQAFETGGGESWYGLGQQQNGLVDLAGENVRMTTHNLVITLPYLVSTDGYGILWDNNSETHFGRPEPAAPIGEHLLLRDANSEEGGLTARYYDGDELLLERTESDLDYQFLARGSERERPLPAEAAEAENLRIEWEGSIASDTGSRFELLMYSSGYAQLAIDGETVLDRWRMNWNPWYHAVKVDLEPGEEKAIRVDWTTQGGYFRLLAHPPAPAAETDWLSFASDTGRAIDYYVVVGDDIDELIGGYRQLTGKSVMLPRWAYGFWQSRERYTSQDELLDALREYRERDLPIDNIVLDWSYWPVDAWGSHDFDPEFFPDPRGMVDQVHAMDARIMISVWPKFYPETDHFKQLDKKGYLLDRNIEEGNRDWIAPGFLNAFYDAWNPAARDMYWRQMDEKLNALGFDAWWLDAVEPDIHSNLSFQKRKWLTSPNHLGTGAEQFNSYAVPHAETVYHGDRAADPDTRTFILTRSGFGGIQRTASAVWSGDIVSRWSNMREQIASGIGVAMAGVPNWTLDIGGFTPEDRFRWSEAGAAGPYTEIPPAELAEWQELNTRWFQFGAFLPLFRSHGQNPYREIYNIAPESSDAFESMAWHLRLRYRLMPYIYSLAGDMHHRDGTLMRGLAMDFPDDTTARRVTDQYLFGPAMLVSPVHEPGVTTRDVYLPDGAEWIDFHSGERHAGGRTVTADAPLATMPLFVRAGSIVPTGPAIQHSGEMLNAPLTLNVYTGANGSFALYEDDGLSYGYERGEWSRIPIHWDDEAGTLTIGEREGGFPGMAERRSIRIRWIDGPTPDATDFDAGIARTLEYDGSPVAVRQP